jgi:hypothetical protein
LSSRTVRVTAGKRPNQQICFAAAAVLLPPTTLNYRQRRLFRNPIFRAENSTEHIDKGRGVMKMKKIAIRKAGSVRLTSAMTAAYAVCGGTGPILA